MKIRHSALVVLLLFALTGRGFAQGEPAQEVVAPSQNNILKLNVTAFAINEARILLEQELSPTSSLEFGVGYIYPNERLVEYAGPLYYGSGFSLQAGYRYYNDGEQDRYFYPRTFRSYLSPILYYNRVKYSERWFFYQGSNIVDDVCQLEDEQFNVVGVKLLFGWQTRTGKAVFDIYSGIGGKMVFSDVFIGARNTGSINGSAECEILPTTEYPNETVRTDDFRITFHIGLKIGFRFRDSPRPDLIFEEE